MRNLTRKLFLSICTLAICAVTLVSTTFAWYTTNAEVSAKGITGTASSYGDASIFISKDQLTAELTQPTTWSQSVTLDKSSQTTIVPVQVLANGTIVKKKTTDGTTAADYLEFTLHFKTSAVATGNPIPLYIKSIVIANTNENPTAITDNLLYNNTDSTKSSGGVDKNEPKYWVDATEALWLNMTSSNDATLDETIFDLTNTTEEVAPINVTTTAGTVDSLAYLNSVTGEGLLKPESGLATEKVLVVDNNTETNALKIADLAINGTHSTVTFRIYLNGWDEFCFDACKGQSFTVDMTFTTVAKDALKANPKQ